MIFDICKHTVYIYKVCKPQQEGGLGLIDIRTWNDAFMCKHLWRIKEKKEGLWVRWVHHRYLQVEEVETWEAHRRDSPLIKAIVEVKNKMLFLNPNLNSLFVEWCDGERFKVKRAYEELRVKETKVHWYKEVWAKGCTPKHSFILWLATLGKLPTLDRLFFLDIDHGCRFCGEDFLETHEHLFFKCPYTKGIWRRTSERFLIPEGVDSLARGLRWLRRYKRKKGCEAKAKTFAFSAAIYFIWHARNAKIYEDNHIPEEVVARLIATHVFRLLHASFTLDDVEKI